MCVWGRVPIFALPWGEMLELSKIDGGEWKSVRRYLSVLFVMKACLFTGYLKICEESSMNRCLTHLFFFTELILVGNTIYWVETINFRAYPLFGGEKGIEHGSRT